MPCTKRITRPPPSSLTSKEASTMSPHHTSPQSFTRKGSLLTLWHGSAPSLPTASADSFLKAPQIFSLLFLWEPPRALLSLLCYLLFTFLPYICLSQRGLCFPMLMILLLLLVCFHIAGTLKGFSITTPHSKEGPTRWGSPSPSPRLCFATGARPGTGLLSHQPRYAWMAPCSTPLPWYAD